MSQLPKRITQTRFRFFFWTWIIALVGRVTIFSSGGFGALACVIAFWIPTAGLLAISVHRLWDSKVNENAKYMLVIVGLAAFCYGVFGPEGLAKEIITGVWLVCFIGLLVISIRGAIQHRVA